MLMNRPDAKALLEVLDFHPPDWRQHYRELFDRFPNLAGRWINMNLWNMPKRSSDRLRSSPAGAQQTNHDAAVVRALDCERSGALRRWSRGA